MSTKVFMYRLSCSCRRGIPKKDVKGPSASQFPKPQQGYNAFLQGYSTAPNGTSSSYQCHGSTKQQQDASMAALSKEQKKNEYEWQSFKIIRKVRKLLGGLKEDSAREKEIAAEIVRIMKAGRLDSINLGLMISCLKWFMLIVHFMKIDFVKSKSVISSTEEASQFE